VKIPALFDRDSYTPEAIDFNEESCLLDICNYFTVKLPDLIFTDLETEEIVIPEVFLGLKNEIKGDPYDRSAFKEMVTSVNESDYDGEERVTVLKYNLAVIHQIIGVQDEYARLRIEGLVEKIDFLEHGE
jgi:hypothetical protein